VRTYLMKLSLRMGLARLLVPKKQVQFVKDEAVMIHYNLVNLRYVMLMYYRAPELDRMYSRTYLIVTFDSLNNSCIIPVG
jgi:hypothetical protein